jgi:hypothetical protein
VRENARPALRRERAQELNGDPGAGRAKRDMQAHLGHLETRLCVSKDHEML